MQCANLRADRTLGNYWERQFCALAACHGKLFILHQAARSEAAQAFCHREAEWLRIVLPDVTLWAPCEHHEIKHKSPLRGPRGRFYGLERYRLESLLEFARRTGDRVFYTIHNHALAGGRESRVNSIHHWFTVDVSDLDGTWRWRSWTQSWVGGKPRMVEVCYWPETLFQPLDQHFMSGGVPPTGGPLSSASISHPVRPAVAA